MITISVVPSVYNMGSSAFAQCGPAVDSAVNFVLRMGRCVCGYIFVVAASSLDYFRKEYNRTLSHEMVYRTWGALGTSKDKQNNILQKAVTMYLSQEVGLELVENAGTVS